MTEKIKVQPRQKDDQAEGRCPRLENWRCGGVGYPAFGVVFDHPRFPDGSPITTSYVRHITDYHLETLNTIYILGKPA